ncbi:MAG: hypothetical protein KKI18_04180 [Planctomycetes bacterium]|nr:hypothetical protein [Planctomycetota bacterium]
MNVYLNRVGDSNIVDVNYSDANSANLPRGFALDITIDSPGLIKDVLNYKTGESTSGSPGYGIYPAAIDINSSGVVTSYGSPLADSCDPGPGDGLNSNHVVLEFGSLYYGAPNAPAASGRLCSLEIDPNGATVNMNIAMVDEDTYRGGLVLEDGSLGDVDANTVFVMAPPECFPGGPGNPLYDEWVAVGKPDCWCASVNPRQCHGDADGLAEGKGSNWTSLNDLAVLKAAWGLSYAAIAGQTAGSPATPLICADSDHTAEGKGLSRVSLLDLAILKANWNLPNLPDPNCALLGY